MMDFLRFHPFIYSDGQNTQPIKIRKAQEVKLWKNNTVPLKQIKAELGNNLQVLLHVDIGVRFNTNM